MNSFMVVYAIGLLIGLLAMQFWVIILGRVIEPAVGQTVM